MAFRLLRRLRGETISRCFLHRSNPNISASTRTYVTEMPIDPLQGHILSLIRNDTNPNISASTRTEMPIDPIQGHILRLIRNDIQYQLYHFPPVEPVQEFSSFSLDGKPGELWFSLKKKFGEDEEIKVDATMFHAVKKSDTSAARGNDFTLHLSIIVDVIKGEGNQILEFVCSVWPDSIKIRKVYTRGPDQAKNQPYGPKFNGLDDNLQRSLYDYLETRGINGDLAVFLHRYVQKKDSDELLLWLEKLKSTIEKKNKE